MEVPKISSRRIRENASLPQEHQLHFHSNHRHIIRRIEEVGLIGGEQFQAAEGRDFVRQEVLHYSLSSRVPMTDGKAAKLCILGLSPLYDDTILADLDPDLNVYLGGLMTILRTFCSKSDFEKENFQRHFSEYGLHLTEVEFNVGQLDEHFNIVWPNMRNQMQLPEWNDSISTILIVSLSMLLIIAKRLVEQSRRTWFRNRWRAISRVLSRVLSTENIEVPKLEALNRLNTVVSARHQIRAGIFRTYRRLALMDIGPFRNAFAVICHQLAFAEMNHIYLIMTYLIAQNPDVLAFPEFMGREQSEWDRALKVIATVPEADRPYLKLLCNGSQYDAVHSKHFVLYTAAARAIAAIDNPSMANYTIRNDDHLRNFVTKVVDHVKRKRLIGKHNAAEAASSYFNPQSAQKMLQSVRDATREEDDYVDHPLPARGVLGDNGLN